ncbi:MarR family transcriptional regulator [Primorskyibacter aestuariivivens]|uniref:MarR family winged helix-turn-helix transcriptional regulator n=1 Tax=Primorskyibacter aestuariivivens TaxID=1888912 RepID=UPI0023013FAB|nr:MarR family transcriptional regulator [Primorskyibacter aestuariivivens]MDA7430347.1 MarR family transcriptional regulator [Primorskyibacter aestuariivivens]
MQLEGFFPYRLAVVADGFSRQLTEVYQRDFGLSREEWRFLFLLADTGSLTSRDLARLGTLDKVQVSRAADRLEAKALIIRAPSPGDRRLKLYTCTDAGRRLFHEVFDRVNAQADQILARMSVEDRAALERGLSTLARATKESGVPSPE